MLWHQTRCIRVINIVRLVFDFVQAYRYSAYRAFVFRYSAYLTTFSPDPGGRASLEFSTQLLKPIQCLACFSDVKHWGLSLSKKNTDDRTHDCPPNYEIGVRLHTFMAIIDVFWHRNVRGVSSELENGGLLFFQFARKPRQVRQHPIERTHHRPKHIHV